MPEAPTTYLKLPACYRVFAIYLCLLVSVIELDSYILGGGYFKIPRGVHGLWHQACNFCIEDCLKAVEFTLMARLRDVTCNE